MLLFLCKRYLNAVVRGQHLRAPHHWPISPPVFLYLDIVFYQPHDGGRGSSSASIGNKPLPLTLFAVIPPELTTAMQPPGTAIVAVIVVASARC